MEGVKMLESKPWFLVIDALLHMKKVDLSIILELIKSVPDIYDDLGRNVRDLVAIWVLENLYERGVRYQNCCDSVVASESEDKMDVSKFCEEVVKLVVREGSTGKLKYDKKGGMLELGVASFASRERFCMQNCALHQLKNEILEGNDPVFKALMDGSGLKVPDETSKVSIPGDVSNGLGDKHGFREIAGGKRKLTSFIAQDDKISEEERPVKKLAPTKRVRHIAVVGNCGVASPEPCGTFEESRDKLKRVLLCFPKKLIETSASGAQHDQLRDSSSRSVEQIEEPVDRKAGPEVNSIEERKGKEDHCADASARLKGNNDTDGGVVFQCQQLVPYDDSTSEDLSGGDKALVNLSVKARGGNECALEPLAATVNASSENIEQNGSGEANDVHNHNLEISDGSDEYHDIRTVVGIRKDYFLSSQGIDTQDSLRTQLNSCVKCNKAGNLLSCSSSSCPVVVHKECLGSGTDFDRVRNFYCPFCAYQEVVSRYQEAKKKFSLAMTDLTTFHVLRADLEELSLSKRSHGSKKQGSGEIQYTNECIEPTNNHDLLNGDIGNLIPPNELDGQVREPSKSSPGDETPCGASGEIEKSSSRDKEVVPGRETHDRMSEKLPGQSEPDAISVPASTDYNAEEGFNAKSKTSDASRDCIRPQKIGRQSKDSIAQLRKKLASTNVDEQTLKTYEFNPVDPTDKWSRQRKPKK